MRMLADAAAAAELLEKSFIPTAKTLHPLKATSRESQVRRLSSSDLTPDIPMPLSFKPELDFISRDTSVPQAHLRNIFIFVAWDVVEAAIWYFFCIETQGRTLEVSFISASLEHLEVVSASPEPRSADGRRG